MSTLRKIFENRKSIIQWADRLGYYYVRIAFISGYDDLQIFVKLDYNREGVSPFNTVILAKKISEELNCEVNVRDIDTIPSLELNSYLKTSASINSEKELTKLFNKQLENVKFRKPFRNSNKINYLENITFEK